LTALKAALKHVIILCLAIYHCGVFTLMPNGGTEMARDEEREERPVIIVPGTEILAVGILILLAVALVARILP
jgi:hypothetical protein